MGALPVSHPKQAVEEMALQVWCRLGSHRQLVDAGRMQLQPLGVACYSEDMSKFRWRFTSSPCSKSADFFFTKLVLGAAIASSMGVRGGEAGGSEGQRCFLRLLYGSTCISFPKNAGRRSNTGQCTGATAEDASLGGQCWWQSSRAVGRWCCFFLLCR